MPRLRLTTAEASSAHSTLAGIVRETITRGRKDKVVIYRDAEWQWRWRRTATNGRILADSGEGYEHRQWCVFMAQRVNRNVRTYIESDEVSD